MTTSLLNYLTGRPQPGNSSTTSPPSDGPCACGPSAYGACAPGDLPSGFRRGALPIGLPTCPEDEITQFGRTNALWVPEYMYWQMVARAATFSPRDPLAAAGVKAGGNLSLLVQLAAAAPATAQGNRYLFPGFMLEIGTSDNVNPSVSDITFAGTFEDGQAYSQTMQFSQGRKGVSRFVIAFTRQTQGGSYPSNVVVERDYQLTLPAVATALTAAVAPNDATTWVPTNGLRAAQQDFTATVTNAVTGTSFRLELLSPVGKFWEWMERAFAGSVQ